MNENRTLCVLGSMPELSRLEDTVTNVRTKKPVKFKKGIEIPFCQLAEVSEHLVILVLIL